MTIFTDGLNGEAEQRGIEELPLSTGRYIGESFKQGFLESPGAQGFRATEVMATDPRWQTYAPDMMGPLPDFPPVSTIPMEEARKRVKEAGLEHQLDNLGSAPEMNERALDVMMRHARERQHREANLARGPSGILPGVAATGAGFLGGALDPLSAAAFAMPVIGEARVAQLMASAGTGVLGRAAVRAGVGAASGAVGMTALQPAEWFFHTEDGRDFGFADALKNIAMGAGLGGVLHAGFGAGADVWRSRVSGKPLYPFAPGEPYERPPAGTGTPPPPPPPPPPGRIMPGAFPAVDDLLAHPEVADRQARPREGFSVSDVLSTPRVAEAIERPNINREHDVPYGALASEAGGVFVDRNIPAEAEISGVRFDPAEPLNVGRQVEREALERMTALFADEKKREPTDAELERIVRYTENHFTTPAEKAWVTSRGIDWEKYQESKRGWIEGIDHENPVHPPEGAYLKPLPPRLRQRIRGGAPRTEPPPGSVPGFWPGPAIWANKDVDLPVHVVDEPPSPGPDGRWYQKVQHDGRDSYVPLDELKAPPAPPAPPPGSVEEDAMRRLRERIAQRPAEPTPQSDSPIEDAFWNARAEPPVRSAAERPAPPPGSMDALKAERDRIALAQSERLAVMLNAEALEARAKETGETPEALKARLQSEYDAADARRTEINKEIRRAAPPPADAQEQARRQLLRGGVVPDADLFARLTDEQRQELARFSADTDAEVKAGKILPMVGDLRKRQKLEALATPPVTEADANISPENRAQSVPGPLPNRVGTFAPGDLLVDAKRFQFKSGGDENGVTERLKGVKTWDDLKAQILIVWEDKDGKFWVVDGHQRHALATRIAAEDPTQNPRLVANILSEKDGINDVKARVYAASVNIAEGTGTAIDAAKILRDNPGMAGLLPPRSELVRQARGLANLSDDGFLKVVDEAVPANYAAIVGRLIPKDADLQRALLDLLEKTEPANFVQAEAIVRRGIETAKENEGKSEGLSSESQIAKSLYAERATILDLALKDLKLDKKVFAILSREGERIREVAGNALAADLNDRRLAADATAIQVLQILAGRAGSVADALDAAAARLRAGDDRKAVVRDFVTALRRMAESGDLARAADGLPKGPTHVGDEDAASVVEPAPEHPGTERVEQQATADVRAVIEETERFSAEPSSQDASTEALRSTFRDELAKMRAEEAPPSPPPAAAPVLPPEPTAAEVAKAAGHHAVSALDEAATGLWELFGKGKRTFSGIGFDEETYAAAKPHFIKAAYHFREFTGNIHELMRRLVRSLRDQYGFKLDDIERMEPYAVRFVEDIHQGRIDLPRAVADEQRSAITQRLAPMIRAAGRPEEEAQMVATAIADRYMARAAALSEDPMHAFEGANVEIHPADALTFDEEGRQYLQRGFWTEDKVARLKKLVTAGKFWNEIGEDLGISLYAAANKASRLGLVRPEVPSARSADEFENLPLGFSNQKNTTKLREAVIAVNRGLSLDKAIEKFYLTPGQTSSLESYIGVLRLRQAAMTFDGIASQMGISRNIVASNVRRLKMMGLLEDVAPATTKAGETSTPEGRTFEQRPTAPPFYSAVERAIQSLPDETMTGEQWWNRFWQPETTRKVAVRDEKNRPTGEVKEVKSEARPLLSGVKPEEMEWLGLEDWLKEQEGSVTKEQIADYVRANRIEVRDVTHEAGEEWHVYDSGSHWPDTYASEAEAQKAREEGAREFAENEWTLKKPRYEGDQWGLLNNNTGRRDEWFDSEEEAREALERAIAKSEREWLDDIRIRRQDVEGGVKYGSYTLPGGENYRELLLTLPEKTITSIPPEYRVERQADYAGTDREWAVRRDTGGRGFGIVGTGRTPEAARADALQMLKGSDRATGNYRSSHWDEANILAHVRFNERVMPLSESEKARLADLSARHMANMFSLSDAELNELRQLMGGKRTLFVEEVQSDWHQAGKRKGYQEPPRNLYSEDDFRFTRTEGEQGKHWFTLPDGTEEPGWGSTVEAARANAREAYERRVRTFEAEDQGRKVPDAPFKTTWPELAMKRMLRYAAEEGYDQVAWTTGATQAERYDLSKQVDRLYYTPEANGTFSVGAQTKDAQHIHLNDGNPISAKELENHVGKEIAERIVAGEGTRDTFLYGPDTNVKYLEGTDLQVGGEGMKGFYDDILPKTVNKLGKKYGTKVGKGEIDTGPGYAIRQTGSFDEWEGYEPASDRRVANFINREEAEEWLKSRPIGKAPVHVLPLTDNLRDAALSEGFPLFQPGREGEPQGRVTFLNNRRIIELFQSADASTAPHEFAHVFLEELHEDAAHPNAPDWLKADLRIVRDWLGAKQGDPLSDEQHEQFARGFEQYLREGRAPSRRLAAIFAKFAEWLRAIYTKAQELGVPINDEIRGVMDRLLATHEDIAEYARDRAPVPREPMELPPARAGPEGPTVNPATGTNEVLPPVQAQDVLKGAIGSLIEGRPVRAGEQIEATKGETDAQSPQPAQEPAAEAPSQEVQPPAPEPLTPSVSLANHFRDYFLSTPEFLEKHADHLEEGSRFATIVQARRFAREMGFGDDTKAIDEAIEQGAVQAARAIALGEGSEADKYAALVNVYDRQPRLSVRTSTSMRDQAYSTPVSLAYLASRLARVEPRKRVYEPSAGNGALLMEVEPPEFAVANEINPARARALEDQGFKVTQKDASDPAQGKELRKAGGVDVVIANPPFGAVKEGTASKVFDLSDIQRGYKTHEIDHAIVLRSLEAMKDDGRAVLLIGGINKLARTQEARSDAYNGKAKREFFKVLFDRYNVTDMFTVAGELYERQGAGWPIDIIVIEGRGKSEQKLPAVEPPRVYKSWDDLAEVLTNAQRSGDEGVPGGQPGATPIELPAGGEAGPVPGGGEAAGGGPVGGGGNAEAGPAADVRVGPVPGQPGNVAVGGERAPPPEELEPGGVGGGAGGLRGEPAAERPSPGVAEKPAEPAKPENVKPRVIKTETETGAQVAYTPQSGHSNLGTLVPVNMKKSVADALAAVAERRGGDVDKFVANELGYSADDLADAFAAEQVDALALALDNIKAGKGFIIGDQTGIGKGRVNAGIIRWAIRNNRIPIFVTEKPNLYGDMYRDLTDIGLANMLGREPRFVMTNADEDVPLSEDGKVRLKTPSPKAHNAMLLGLPLNPAKFLKEYDAVFTTYNQMNPSGGETPRREFLRRIAPQAVVIFDESHNAGGTGTAQVGKTPNRAVFARDLVARAMGVFYSSATYAKRPEVMDLYSKTDMVLAVANPKELGEAIAKGGVPMQQAVAAMLARAGQYLRRERSFAGVEYNTPTVAVDQTAYRGISRSLNSINEFSKVVARVAKQIDKEIRAEAEAVGYDGAVGEAGAESTKFTSIMHNIVNQVLLAMKAKPTAKMAIEALQRGEKPVITVAGTMETFYKQFAEQLGIKFGEPIPADFSHVLTRYLDRTRTLILKKPFSDKPAERKYLSDAELGPVGIAAYRSAKRLIESLDLKDLPVSPIDAIKDELRAAGYRVGEITGRGTIVDYSGKQPILRARPGAEQTIKGRQDTILRFNGGSKNKPLSKDKVYDAMVINQAGSTGLSLHASEKFADQNLRHMFIAQPEANIDTHMQLLGRIHRTGQVVLPRYSQLIADIPAEKRPAAVLAKKMASLNANTTAARGSAMTAKDVPDFMNVYGDMVAAAFIEENPDFNARLGDVFDLEGGKIDTVDGAMRRLTGRIPLLDPAEQARLYDHLESEYASLLEQMKAAGENALEAQTLDLRAQTVERREVVARRAATDSPFAAPVQIEKVLARRLGKPFRSDEVVNRILENIGQTVPEGVTAQNAARVLSDIADRRTPLGKLAAASHEKQAADAVIRFEDYKRSVVDDIENPDRAEAQRAKMDADRDRFSALHEQLAPGVRVNLKTANGNLTGVVLKVEQKGKPKNPLALSTWKADIAIADATKRIELPFSRLFAEGTSDPENMLAIELGHMSDWIESRKQTLDRFDRLQSDVREERYIATGNLLAAYDWLNRKGRIVNYTDAEGHTRQGILTPRDFNFNEHAQSKATPIGDEKAVIQWLRDNPRTELKTDDGAVKVILNPGRGAQISVAGAKRIGGSYYLDKELTGTIGRDFVKQGGSMVAGVREDRLEAAIRRIQELGGKFVAVKELPPAEQVAAPPPRAPTMTPHEAWNQLAKEPLPHEEREAVEASREAERMKEPESTSTEPSVRAKAATKMAEESVEQFESSKGYMSDEDRKAYEEAMQEHDREQARRAEVIKQGIACLSAGGFGKEKT